jgi:hypothetical protein
MGEPEVDLVQSSFNQSAYGSFALRACNMDRPKLLL